jgi:hypothetical protein
MENGMIIQQESEDALRPDQVRAMARGFYHLASVDSISEQEKELISDFLKHGKLELDLEAVSKIPFSVEGLAYALDTMFLRKLFLKACIILVRSDEKISPEEKAELERLAKGLGFDDTIDSLLSEVEGKLFS